MCESASANSFRFSGLSRKLLTPSPMACRAYSNSEYPVIMPVTVSGQRAATRRASSRPDMPGILMSVTSMSTSSRCRNAQAWSPVRNAPAS